MKRFKTPAADFLMRTLVVALLALSVSFAGCCEQAHCQEPGITIPHEQIELDGNTMKPYLCVFSATWCAPCQKMKPDLESMRADGYLVYIIDTDKSREQADAMGVKSLPTIVMMAGGKERARLIGRQDGATLRKLFDRFRDVDDSAPDDGSKPDDGTKPDDDDAGIDLPNKLDYRLL